MWTDVTKAAFAVLGTGGRFLSQDCVQSRALVLSVLKELEKMSVVYIL
jgi:hypothetical protein